MHQDRGAFNQRIALLASRLHPFKIDTRPAKHARKTQRRWESTMRVVQPWDEEEIG